MSTDRVQGRPGHVAGRGRFAAATANAAGSRRHARARRHTRIGVRAVIALAALLTSAALYGLAAISIRTSQRVIAATALSDYPECAVRHLIGWGSAHCPPLEERP